MREWLKQLRGSMTTKEVAQKLGISQQYYSLIESGERQKKMDVQTCVNLATVFGVSPYDIIKYEIGQKVYETHNS